LGVTDEELIAQVVEGAYDTLAFDPGGEPDWARFAEVFVPNALLALRVFPGDPEVRVMDLPGYFEAQMGGGLKDEGYSETPSDRVTEVLGDVAVVRQRFTMNFTTKPPAAAVDLFSLVRTGGRWLIVSVVSDMER
jgi:Putative lumazine-binding